MPDDLIEVERQVRTLTTSHFRRPEPSGPGPLPEHSELDLYLGAQAPDGGGRSMPMSKEVIIGDGSFVVKVTPTYKGRPASLDGPPTVEVADPALFTFEVQPDGTSIRFRDQGVEGITEATISADVKAGEEVLTRSTSLMLVAVNPTADTLGLDIGEQEPEEPPSGEPGGPIDPVTGEPIPAPGGPDTGEPPPAPPI